MPLGSLQSVTMYVYQPDTSVWLLVCFRNLHFFLRAFVVPKAFVYTEKDHMGNIDILTIDTPICASSSIACCCISQEHTIATSYVTANITTYGKTLARQPGPILLYHLSTPENTPACGRAHHMSRHASLI